MVVFVVIFFLQTDIAINDQVKSSVLKIHMEFRRMF